MQKFSQNVSNALDQLRAEKIELPGVSDDQTRFDTDVAESFSDCSILNVSDFEYDRSFRYIIRTPAIPIQLDRLATSNQLKSVGKIDDLNLAISCIGKFVQLQFVSRLESGEIRRSAKPSSPTQVVLQNGVDRFLARTGYELLDADVLSTIVPDLETENCEFGEATVADLLF